MEKATFSDLDSLTKRIKSIIVDFKEYKTDYDDSMKKYLLLDDFWTELGNKYKKPITLDEENECNLFLSTEDNKKFQDLIKDHNLSIDEQECAAYGLLNDIIELWKKLTEDNKKNT